MLYVVASDQLVYAILRYNSCVVDLCTCTACGSVTSQLYYSHVFRAMNVVYLVYCISVCHKTI